MQSPIYALVWVTGVFCLWLFWDFAVKRVALDLFRERIFELRFALFRLGMEDKLDYNSEVYRQLETLLCGLLQFGHKMTFLSYCFANYSQSKAKKEKGYMNISAQITLRISRLESGVQDELRTLMNSVSRAVAFYMAFTSLFFLTAAVVIAALRVFGFWHPERLSEASNVIEQEAYRAEVRRHRKELTLAPA